MPPIPNHTSAALKACFRLNPGPKPPRVDFSARRGLKLHTGWNLKEGQPDARMSAYRPEPDIQAASAECLLLTLSGHSPSSQCIDVAQGAEKNTITVVQFARSHGTYVYPFDIAWRFDIR